MDRKINEEFDYNGQTLKVIECDYRNDCKHCFFDEDDNDTQCLKRNKKITGECIDRKDKQYVKFVLVKNNDTINSLIDIKIKLIIKEAVNTDHPCDGCIFIDENNCIKPDNFPECNPNNRADKKDIIFKLNNIIE